MSLSTANLCLALLLPFVAPAPSNGSDRVYENALAKAIERAQAKLQDKVELFTDHSTWDKAREVASKRYRVRTTKSHAFGKRVATELDGMSEHFRKLIAPDFDWTTPAIVHVYPDVAAYNKFGEEKGEYHSSIYGSFFAKAEPQKPVVMVFHDNLTLERMYATHGAAHQFLDRVAGGRELPTWVNEGVASYFALWWAWKYGSDELARFQKQRTWVPIRTLLSDEIDKYTQRPHERFIELGMLFNYLLYHRAETKSKLDKDGVPQGPFVDYLRQVIAGKSVDDHEVHKLLFEHTRELDAAFRAYEFKF